MLLRTCVTFTTRKNIFSLKEGFHGDLNPFDFFSYWHLWRWKKMWLIFLWFNDLVVETGNAAGLKTPHLIPANKGRNVPLLDLFLWVLGNFWLFVWWLRSSNPTWIKMKKYLRVPIFGGEKYLCTLGKNASPKDQFYKSMNWPISIFYILIFTRKNTTFRSVLWFSKLDFWRENSWHIKSQISSQFCKKFKF